MSDVIDEHRLYLSDQPRLDAYEAALAAVVRDGDVVLDLGAGSGILGLLACRAGAGKVYAIEETGLISLTRRIAADNGLAARIEHVKALSLDVSLPERADVVCCDQIGRFGFEAGVFGYFADAARRLAKPDARFVPAAIELHVAPVSLPERAADVSFWERPVRGFDVRAATEVARNSGYPCRLEPGHLLGPGARVARQATTVEDAIVGEAELVVERDGTLDGLGGWFRAELAPGVVVTNDPGATARIERRNVFLPIAASVAARAGVRVRVRLHVIPRETLLTWTVEVVTPDGARLARSQHSTFRGMFLSPEELRVTRPDHVPALTPRGRARRTVLELCDGARTVREIEQAVAARHADLFPGLREAACFVAEVVTRYAR